MHIILHVSLDFRRHLNLEPLPLIIVFLLLSQTGLLLSQTITHYSTYLNDDLEAPVFKAQLSYSNTKLLPPRARAKLECSPRFRKSQK